MHPNMFINLSNTHRTPPGRPKAAAAPAWGSAARAAAKRGGM